MASIHNLEASLGPSGCGDKFAPIFELAAVLAEYFLASAVAQFQMFCGLDSANSTFFMVKQLWMTILISFCLVSLGMVLGWGKRLKVVELPMEVPEGTLGILLGF